MESDRQLITLLAQCLSGDANLMGNASATLNGVHYRQKSCLASLLTVAVDASVGEDVRQLATVELGKLLTFFWGQLTEQEKCWLKTRYLDHISVIATSKIAGSTVNTVAVMAECALKEAEWPEFLLLIASLAKQRESPMKALNAATLIDASVEPLIEHERDSKNMLPQLLESILFDQSTALDVKVAAAHAFGRLASFMQLPQAVVNQMFAVLQIAFEQQSSDAVAKMFDSFSNLFYFAEALMTRHYLLPLVQLCTAVVTADAGGNAEQIQRFRVQALNFLSSTLICHLESPTDSGGVILALLLGLLRVMLEPETAGGDNGLDTCDWDTPVSLSEQTIEALVFGPESNELLERVLQFVRTNFWANQPYSCKNLLNLLGSLSAAFSEDADVLSWFYALLKEVFSRQVDQMTAYAVCNCLSLSSKSASQAVPLEFFELVASLYQRASLSELKVRILKTLRDLCEGQERYRKTLPAAKSTEIQWMLLSILQGGTLEVKAACLDTLAALNAASSYVESGFCLDPQVLNAVISLAEAEGLGEGQSKELLQMKESALLALNSVFLGDHKDSVLLEQVAARAYTLALHLVSPASPASSLKQTGYSLLSSATRRCNNLLIENGAQTVEYLLTSASALKNYINWDNQSYDGDDVQVYEACIRCLGDTFASGAVQLSGYLDSVFSVLESLCTCNFAKFRRVALISLFTVVDGVQKMQGDFALAAIDRLSNLALRLFAVEDDPEVVTVVLEQYAEKLKTVGPTLVEKIMQPHLTKFIQEILSQTHICFSDELLDDESDGEEGSAAEDECDYEDSGELELGVLEACGDLLIALCQVLGASFTAFYTQQFHKHLEALLRKAETRDETKSMAAGAIGGVAAEVGPEQSASFSPGSVRLMLPLLNRTKNTALVSNLSYALGHLTLSQVSDSVQVNNVLQALSKWLDRSRVGDDNAVDNSVAAIFRILPKVNLSVINNGLALLDEALCCLPLKSDKEESTSVCSSLMLLSHSHGDTLSMNLKQHMRQTLQQIYLVDSHLLDADTKAELSSHCTKL